MTDRVEHKSSPIWRQIWTTVIFSVEFYVAVFFAPWRLPPTSVPLPLLLEERRLRPNRCAHCLYICCIVYSTKRMAAFVQKLAEKSHFLCFNGYSPCCNHASVACHHPCDTHIRITHGSYVLRRVSIRLWSIERRCSSK